MGARDPAESLHPVHRRSAEAHWDPGTAASLALAGLPVDPRAKRGSEALAAAVKGAEELIKDKLPEQFTALHLRRVL